MKRIRNKVASRAGESIAETLVAVLIMALAFLILTGAVLTAARINARVKNEDVAFTAQTGDPAPADKLISVAMDGETDPYRVTYHVTNGYAYYDNPTKYAEPAP